MKHVNQSCPLDHRSIAAGRRQADHRSSEAGGTGQGATAIETQTRRGLARRFKDFASQLKSGLARRDVRRAFDTANSPPLPRVAGPKRRDGQGVVRPVQPRSLLRLRLLRVLRLRHPQTAGVDPAEQVPQRRDRVVVKTFHHRGTEDTEKIRTAKEGRKRARGDRCPHAGSSSSRGRYARLLPRRGADISCHYSRFS